jgi:ParB family chromosome partitioning protein
MVLVCAGQRRLLALQHIAAPDTLVPVRIVDEATAVEVSLAENLERKDMNPADEVEAFKALVDLGTYDDARISSRFGFTLQHVRRRLKMANLLPEILDALRDGKISLDAATAYASASEEAQRDIFKKHNAKGAWQPHEPRQIRSDISLHGISAGSAVAKFIGGIEAYKAAGGTTIDDDFKDMFADRQDAGRLRDVTVVRALIEKRQAELSKEAGKLAHKRWPFATGVEWMDLIGTNWGSSVPKPSKASGLVAVEQGWGADAASTFADRAKAAAAEHGGAVIALVDVGPDGELKVVENKLLVGKAAWDATRPADAENDDRHNETPEERAARTRESEIKLQMERMYARSLIGDTPGFGVMHVDWDRYNERFYVSLARLDGDNADIDFTDQWNPRLKAELLEPFREAAAVKVDELEAERQAAEQRASIKAEQDRASFGEKLDDLEALPIAEWPAAVVLEVDGYPEATLEITRGEDADGPMLDIAAGSGDSWESRDAAETVTIIRDQSAEHEVTIATFATIEEYEQAESGEGKVGAELESEAA